MVLIDNVVSGILFFFADLPAGVVIKVLIVDLADVVGFALKGFFVELVNFKVFLFDVIILFVEDIVEVGTFECSFLVLC